MLSRSIFEIGVRGTQKELYRRLLVEKGYNTVVQLGGSNAISSTPHKNCRGESQDQAYIICATMHSFGISEGERVLHRLLVDSYQSKWSERERCCLTGWLPVT